jgi:hypothetical protein
MEQTSSVPKSSLNKDSKAYSFGDKIGFAIDMDKGTMQFFRNGKHIEGADIKVCW